MKLSLGKDKRLKSKKKIERLFSKGKMYHRFPVRMVYFYEDSSIFDFQIAVSAPKKFLKKAVDRNLIKRRIKEAFRIHQNQLKVDGKIEIMFIYSTSELKDYQTIEKSIQELIEHLNKISSDDISEK